MPTRTHALLLAVLFLSNVAKGALVGWASQNGGTTGGEGGKAVTVKTYEELTAALGTTDKVVIKVQGKITGDLSILREKGSNKTIEGVSPGAELDGFMIIREVKNVIIRNLVLRQVDANSGSLDVVEITMSSNVWIDHCDISDLRTTTDGMLDIVRGSDYVTVSWTKLSYPNTNSNHRLAMLIGNKDDNGAEDSGKLRVTLHHNWYGDNIQERMPRIRFGKIHVFNNYYSSKVNNYCVGAGKQAQAVVESNYFDAQKDPHIFFGGEPTAQIRINGDNQYVNTTGSMQEGQGRAFTIPYAYAMTAGKDVKDVVMAGAGPFGKEDSPSTTGIRRISGSHDATMIDANGNHYAANGTKSARLNTLQGATTTKARR